MAEEKFIASTNDEEIWQQLEKNLAQEDVFEYNVVIQQGDHHVQLTIDNDPGGGFESGIQSTLFTSPLTTTDPFRFAIHKEGFLDEIGKFFGMQDVLTGYPAFDEHVVVKTNDEERVKKLFSGEDTTLLFQSFPYDFTFGITTRHHKPVLEFSTDVALTETDLLKKIYHAFYAVLLLLEQPSGII